MPERFTSRWDTLAFLACLVLSLVARAAPDGLQETVASGVRSTLAAPLLAIQQQTELFKTFRTRSEALVAQRDSAVRRSMDVDGLREENAQLRELLALGPRIPARHVSTEVLHQSSPANGLVLLLAAGSDRGVRPLSPVLAPDGLLGVVRTVDRDHAVAVIWPHPDFRASAMSLDGRVSGILQATVSQGPDRILLELHGVPIGTSVPTGTMLYTAGFGGVYPRGIPVGSVIGIASEITGLSRTYFVEPAVQPATVSHVLVLIDRIPDLTNAFSEGPS